MMKKWCMLGVLLAALTSQVFALDMGIKAGTTSSAYAGSSALGNSASRSGLVIGGYLSQGFLLFDLQVEGLYIEKGNSFSSGGFNRYSNISYFEVPVLAKIKPLPLIDLSVYAGPYAAFLLSGKDFGKDGVGADINGDSSIFNSLDYGAVIGVGYRFFAFSADARYEVGFQDVYKSLPGFKNGTLSLSVGYGF
jgi:hypothetical protein